MTDTIVGYLVLFVVVVQPLFLVYFLLYNTYTLWLIALSARQVRRRVAGHFIEDLDLIDEGDLTKPLTMIVPAYNEEVTIVDSVTGLINSDYPRFEIVVVNDGSTDATLERLKRAFRLRRTDVPYRPAIATAPVRAMYEATLTLPRGVMQVIVIDKDNGGKADALNAGINASTTPYFVSLDADSILDQRALKELMRVVQEDPKVVAVGGQVAIANGCTVRNSHVVHVGLPRRSLARFQMVEYLRSFTAARTGLDRVHAILILSGVFAVFEKETVIRAGGYLTPYLRHRLTEEYVGGQARTVCEDMEIIVRLHRFVLDKLHDRRIAFLPHPVAWTEVPETFESLRKQRGRWYRGLRESLRYHRGMMWRPKFGRIGWFALPAFWLFEYLGPLVEVAGYLFVLFLFLVEKNPGTADHQLRVPSRLPPGLVGLWRSGQHLRRTGRGLALPLRPGGPAPAPPASFQPAARGVDPAPLCVAGKLRLPPAHIVLETPGLVGCVAGKDRVGEIRPGRLPAG
jgi:cellulose synthase/poly-beta-1,6-N-acetylglucosamine synthase-like glycosyltransferase